MKTLNISHGIGYGNDGKKRWTTLGVVFVHDDGGMSIKFDYAPPVGEYLNVFDKKESGYQEQGPPIPEPVMGDDVPF